MWIPARLDLCPECGAYRDETTPPQPNRTYDLLLTLTVGGVLLAALVILAIRSPLPVDPDPSSSLLAPEAFPTPTPTPWPTPTPLPQPTPTPLPRPTPTPFNPILVAATPTPVPTATPIPLPTPTPNSRTFELRDRILLEYRSQLDRNYPFAMPGEQVTLNTLNGDEEQGEILRMEEEQILLSTGRGEIRIPYRKLDPASRIRVDRREREAQLEEKALEEVIRRLREN